ncbi:hypothetical protein C1H46_036916 [Malus baccata]|uniref:BRX domain-containing protein n=1 Tax=Malus baccata TaxID=106549 RepID=A0A540KU78_MALBA|nr:hypothetical protein C1H46_036916 [Malus baccata]
MLRMDRMTADQAKAGPLERDIDLAITALKKGAQLLKYGRRGKPKFCPFRLSNDESVLIWYSGNEEKYVKLTQVSRIVPGQRTQTFQRYPRPEKEYQSFSLIYNDRSLDLICKDKDEAEVWFTGLKALISRGLHQKRRAESRSGVTSEANSPRSHTQQSSPLSSPFRSGDSSQKDGAEPFHLHAAFESPPKIGLEKTLSDVMLYALPPKIPFPSDASCGSVPSSGGSDGMNGRTKGASVDAFRVSLSSAVSSSSQGSGHDEGDALALGDVFIWGEGVGDCFLAGGSHRVGSSSGCKMDSFVPKVLESAVVLDVQSIACGGRHAAFVTKQGEVFSWGEELGGRLGHGVDADVSHPKLIDALKNMNIELLACGEYHSCAVTLSGDMYTWGASNSNFALLGHGSQSSQWVPKKLNGPLEGIHVSSVSCGPWHTAVVTSAGQLFTFGDGTFGLKEMAERLPIGTARNMDTRPLDSSSPTHEVSTTAVEKTSSLLNFHEPYSVVSDSVMISGVPRATSNHTEVTHSEATARHKNRGTKTEIAQGDEWVEQDEPGVYITLVSLPGGVKDLKRVRFSRKRFSEKQAEQWWAANRGRVYQQYNVPVVEKSSIPMGREGLAH